MIRLRGAENTGLQRHKKGHAAVVRVNAPSSRPFVNKGPQGSHQNTEKPILLGDGGGDATAIQLSPFLLCDYNVLRRGKSWFRVFWAEFEPMR